MRYTAAGLLALLTILFSPVAVAAAPPTVQTLPITFTSWEEAVTRIDIFATGGWMVQEWGVEYGTTPESYLNSVTVEEEVNPSVRTVALVGLAPNTTYYYRAKARNKDGWGYGVERSFTTMPEGTRWQEWTVVEDVWVGRNDGEWYMKKAVPVIFVGYSCVVDIACGGGFRFGDTGELNGHKIDEAYLLVRASSSQLGSPKSVIRASGDGSPFTTIEDYWDRERVAEVVHWDDPVKFAGEGMYRSPDISAMIQQVVDAHDIMGITVLWDDHDDRSGHEQANQRVVYSGETRLVVKWSVLGNGDGGNGDGDGSPRKGSRWMVIGGAGGVAVLIGVAMMFAVRGKRKVSGGRAEGLE